MPPNPANTVTAPPNPAAPVADGPADGVEPPPASPPAPRALRRRWLVLGSAGAVALVLFLVLGLPWLRSYFSHESTDDAYVNSHVTYVAPRVTGTVTDV